MRTERLGLAALLTVTVVWGTTFPAMKQLSTDLSALQIIWLRFGLAALVLLPLWRGIRRAEWRWGLGLGGLNFLAFWLQIEGLALTTSNRNAFVTGLNVLLVPLIAWLVLRRRTGWQVWAACALAVAGMCLMFFEDTPWNRGDTLTLGSAVVYALYILGLEAAARRHQAAPLGQLPDQFIDQCRRRGGDDDGIERAVLGPAGAAIIVLGADIHAQRTEALARLSQQVADAFDGVDLQAQRAEHGGLVAGAGTDFQHFLWRDLQHGFGHARHHPRLRDGLAVADRQGGVFVGA